MERKWSHYSSWDIFITIVILVVYSVCGESRRICETTLTSVVVGSGRALVMGGPLSCFLAYSIFCVIVWCGTWVVNGAYDRLNSVTSSCPGCRRTCYTPGEYICPTNPIPFSTIPAAGKWELHPLVGPLYRPRSRRCLWLELCL